MYLFFKALLRQAELGYEEPNAVFSEVSKPETA